MINWLSRCATDQVAILTQLAGGWVGGGVGDGRGVPVGVGFAVGDVDGAAVGLALAVGVGVTDAVAVADGVDVADDVGDTTTMVGVGVGTGPVACFPGPTKRSTSPAAISRTSAMATPMAHRACVLIWSPNPTHLHPHVCGLELTGTGRMTFDPWADGLELDLLNWYRERSR